MIIIHHNLIDETLVVLQSTGARALPYKCEGKTVLLKLRLFLFLFSTSTFDEIIIVTFKTFIIYSLNVFANISNIC